MREVDQLQLFEKSTEKNGQSHTEDGRPGFKKTKVGWIPEDWECTYVATMGEVVTGATPSTSQREYYDGPFPFVAPGDLAGRRDVIESEKSLSKEGLSQARRLPARSVLFTCIGSTIGKTGLAGCELATNQQINAVVANSDNNPIYLYYVLTYQAERIKLIAGTQAVPIINKSTFEKAWLPRPPRDEQKRIAGVLSLWDRALDRIDALIVTKERQKHAVMQRLLTGQVRFPEFAGQIWLEKRLAQIGTVVTGGTPDTQEPAYWSGDVAWCTPTDITGLNGSKYLHKTERTITQAGVGSSAATLLPVGSLVVCTRATLGDCAINKVPVATNQGFKSIIPGPQTDVEYLYYQIVFHQHEIMRLGCGSTFLEVSKKDFSRIAIPFPSLGEQRQIGQVLARADEEIESLRQQRKAFESEKKALMQRLLTGQVRVPEDYSPPAL